MCPRPTGRASGRSTSNDNDAKEHHQRQEPHDENLPLKMRAAPEDSQTIFRLGRSGAGVGGGSTGLQAVENIGNRSESNSHSAPPEAPFCSDFVSGLCLGKELIAEGVGRHASDRLLSVKQVAERLGVTTATVYGLCADGRLAHVRILNTIRVVPGDLAAFIESRRVPVAAGLTVQGSRRAPVA